MPKLYLLNHRIVPTPSMIYSGVPFGTEMLYGLALALGAESSAKLLHFGFGAAAAAAIYSWCKKHVNRKAAILAALLFYSAPMVCFESTVAMVELAMTFYVLLAALVVLDAIQAETATPDAKALVLAGTLAGFAVGTKYNAGLYVPVLALPLIYRNHRDGAVGARALARQLALFFASAALAFAPWALKNWLFYHDPVFPFFCRFFKGNPVANAAGLSRDAYVRNIGAAFTTWAGFKDLLTGLWNPYAHNIDSYVGPALEIGLPWLLLARWQSVKQRSLVIMVAGIWLAWALHTSLPRFIMPAIPLFCILVAEALCRADMPRKLRALLIGFTGYTIVITMAAIFMMLADPGTWKVAYGRMTKPEYLLHEHPSYKAPYYAGVEFINRNLPQDAVVLFVGEERGFYCERKFITASVFDVNPLTDLAESSANEDVLLANLRGRGIDYLLVNAGSSHYADWRKGLSPKALLRYENLLKNKARLLFEHNKQYSPDDRSWVQVFKLGDSI